MKLVDLPIVGCLFNGIPGPLVDKTSFLWSLFYLLRGSFRQVVEALHRRSGPVVQVAPQRYSVLGKQQVCISNLRASAYSVDFTAHNVLKRALAMEKLFAREADIDKCNHKFVALLPGLIEHEDVATLPSLVARYAWEVLLQITTDQQAGFLEKDADVKGIDAALNNWKFYSILYSSYLTYHPYITRALKCFFRKDHMLQQENIESRIALCLAGADPAITLISAVLQHIYGDRDELFQDLHDELMEAKIESIPSFKTLILSRPQLPLLYAVLQECARVTPPRPMGHTFAITGGGVKAAEHVLPPGHLISVEESLGYADHGHPGEVAHAWNLEQWLDQPLTATMKRQLLAFNISAGDDIEQFQLLLAAKLLVQVITRSGKPKGPPPTSSEDGGVSIDPEGSKTSITLAAADTLTTWLSPEDAEALLTGRLAPHHKKYNNEAPVFTRPVDVARDRALVHEAVHKTHGNRLAHFTELSTNVMCIGPHHKIPRHFRQRNQGVDQNRRGHHQRGGTTRVRNRGPCPAPVDSRTSNWGSWAHKEGIQQDYFKTEEGYRERQEKVKQIEDARNQQDRVPDPVVKFKETFKQTSMETVNGKLGGPRKLVSMENSNEAGEEKTAKEKPKPIAPHLRRKIAALQPQDA